MSESPEVPINPAVTALVQRRTELMGGEQSIGMQEQQVAQMQTALDEALARLADCEAELAALDAAIALLSPVPTPVPELEV